MARNIGVAGIQMNVVPGEDNTRESKVREVQENRIDNNEWSEEKTEEQREGQISQEEDKRTLAHIRKCRSLDEEIPRPDEEIPKPR